MLRVMSYPSRCGASMPQTMRPLRQLQPATQPESFSLVMSEVVQAWEGMLRVMGRLKTCRCPCLRHSRLGAGGRGRQGRGANKGARPGHQQEGRRGRPQPEARPDCCGHEEGCQGAGLH